MADNEGKTVRVHYTGTLLDGTVFDTTRGKQPVEFICGSGSVMPGFEQTVKTMEVGEVKTTLIPCEFAFGRHDRKKVEVVPLDQIPNSDMLPEGEYITLYENGRPAPALVKKIDHEANTVTFDFNDKLCDKDLQYEIELVSVVESPVVTEPVDPATPAQ